MTEQHHHRFQETKFGARTRSMGLFVVEVQTREIGNGYQNRI